MDTNNISCPVCTLYLRPGITLKSHLTSHPKQKVIEALVRLANSEDAPKVEDPPQQDDSGNATSETSTVVSQSENNDNLTTQPITSLQQNQVIIYQQSMSSNGSTTPPNLINPVSTQYIIPAMINPQMMSYMYQQQLIMARSSVLPMRSLPSSTCVKIDSLPDNSGLENSFGLEAASITEQIDEPSCIDTANSNIDNEIPIASIIKSDSDLQEQLCESLDLDVYKVDQTTESSGDNQYIDEDDDGPPSLTLHLDLDKECQTENTECDSPTPPLLVDELEDTQKPVEPELIFIEEPSNTPYTSMQLTHHYEQTNPIYTPSNMMNSGDHLDFGSMDGMQVVINDINEFSGTQIISQVEHFENNTSDRDGVLLTIGEIIDNSKDDFIEQRDLEESMSRGSSNVNIRAYERMPPRGELSGQESLGGSSDLTWNRLNYNEGSSRMSSSYDLLARESWDASDSSDVDEPPLQSRVPPPLSDAENDDNDTPMIVSFNGPPLNFKCPHCEESFVCSKDRKMHETNKHPDKMRKLNRIGYDIGKAKTKKLVVKMKSDVSETENNFDNVFTNKLKIETSIIDFNNEEGCVDDPAEVVKIDDVNVSVDLKVLCSLCDCVLVNAKALKEHKLNVHHVTSQNRHKCMTCEEVFPNDYKFSEHLRLHPLECKVCGRLFYRRQNMQLHMRRHLGIKPYKCDVCEKAFLTKQKLDEHRHIHTGEAPIKCNLCEETFKRHSNLVQHRNRHHLNIKKKIRDYICYCKEVFHSKKKLAWHKETHDPKPKACTQCNEKFVHMSSLTRHMRRAHNDRFLPKGHKDDANVECPLCKGIYLKSSLDVHIRSHSGQRPFSCLICNKEFTTKWNLKLHKWTHASRMSKPFKCDQCKGAFIRESDYTSHMNSHKRVRPYTCNYCGAQFIRKYNCQRHVKEHENAKLFSCQVCGKKFHRSYYLKDHMRIHSGVRPFSCHICGKTSTTKSNHNKHVQIHHAREPVSTEN